MGPIQIHTADAGIPSDKASTSVCVILFLYSSHLRRNRGGIKGVWSWVQWHGERSLRRPRLCVIDDRVLSFVFRVGLGACSCDR